MKRIRNPLPVMLAASVVLLTGVVAGPVQAAPSAMDYDAVVPCSAFQRSGHGGWTALAPVTLGIDNGIALSFRPGDRMAPGSTIAGVAVPIILERHCGNM